MSKPCPECHHTPSCRVAEYGAECQCQCHDVADASPDLLAALKDLISSRPTKEPPKEFAVAHRNWEKFQRARAAIAKAEGQQP